MNDLQDNLVPIERLRVMQIIALALLLGVISFLGVALFLVMNRNPAQAGQRPPILSYVAGGMLIMNACMAVMVPYFMTRAGLARLAAMPSTGNVTQDRQTALQHLLGLRQTGLIMALAMLEGAAFLGCIAFIVEGQWFVVGVVAVATVLMALRFPTHRGITSWLERQLSLLEEMRGRGY
jgi:hypothetical protein